ncbi:MAG TPA: hypothetical protein VF191_01505, partial [Cyclobacteriaceae bacterium]
ASNQFFPTPASTSIGTSNETAVFIRCTTRSFMMSTFSPIDLLFYGLAAYEGYRFSFRQISEAEILANAGR